MKYFNIKKEIPIVIYGLGNIGKQKCQILLDSGYQIVSLIDKNAANLPQFCGVQALTMEEFCEEFFDRKEVVIIVCLNNGMQHETVANDLNSHGYDKILYIPMDGNREYSYLSEMQKAYSAFLDNKFDVLDKIPVYIKGHHNVMQGIQILSSDFENITFLCEIEYLFSPDEQTIRGAAATENILKNALEKPKYIDIPIVMCKNYSNLYDYIMGKVNYPSLYIKYLGKDEKYNRKLLEDRIGLFQCYEQRYAVNAGLFYIQPLAVKWNPKGYFNICDGMHRAMFLYYVKNHFKIPIRTTTASFECFKNYHKENDSFYKSEELILQENLFKYFDVINSKGAAIGREKGDIGIESLKKMSKNVVLFMEIDECTNSTEIFDYVFIHSSLLASYAGDILGEIFRITPRIIIEYFEDTQIKRNLLSEKNVIKLGSILKKNFERTSFYLLER